MLENLKIGPEYEGFLFLAEAARNPPVLRPHHHVELEMNLVVSGELTYVVDGVRYRFPKRSLLWIFPSQEHQLVDRSSDAGYYVAVFKPDLIARACRTSRYEALRKKRPSQNGVIHCDLDPDSFENLSREMADVVADGLDPDLLNREAGFGLSEHFSFEHNDPDWLNAALRHFLLLGWRLQQRPSAGRAVQLHHSVRRALDLIDKGAEEEASLDSLAEACGVSRSFLSRSFQTGVGVSLTRYRNSVRMGRFWELRRKHPRATLLESVFDAGFGSYSQFFRVYTSIYGESPRSSLAIRPGAGGSKRVPRSAT